MRALGIIAIVLIGLAAFYLMCVLISFGIKVFGGDMPSVSYALLEYPFSQDSQNPFVAALYPVRVLLLVSAGVAAVAALFFACVYIGIIIERGR